MTGQRYLAHDDCAIGRQHLPYLGRGSNTEFARIGLSQPGEVAETK